MIICSRCGGSGYIHKWRHIEGGICFKCRGNGYMDYSTFDKNQRLSTLRTKIKLKEQQRKEELLKTLDSFNQLPF